MINSRINKTEVLAAIYSESNARRVIWSPCTTLEIMDIEHYPHVPNDNRLAMKRLLRELCANGHLVERSELHTHYTFKETAYERSRSVNG